VHRDIKPENVMLAGGHALVADFGIALAASRSDGGTRMTETGMSLGTPHYMSPEQAMGEREITPKADIYALGCVTYEMLTGEPPFTGPTAQAIIARVMTEEPRSLTLQRRTVPPGTDAVVRKALEKLPADRYATAREFERALAAPTAASPERPYAPAHGRTGAPRASGAGPSGRWLAAAPWVVAVVALLLLARGWLRPHPTPLVGRFSITLAPPPHLSITGQALVFSPDGSRIAFVGDAGAGDQLFVRGLDQLGAAPLAGTAGAESPFFSPSGGDVAFYAGGKLQRVAVGGGLSAPVCDVVGAFRGGTWSERDLIVFADDRGLLRVGATGGTPVLLARPDSGETFRWPDLLPGGRVALFSTFGAGTDRLAAVAVAGGSVRRLDVRAANPHWVRGGYVVASQIEAGGGLGATRVVALPFDASGLRVTGPAIPVADSVLAGLTSRTAKMGVSREGTMAYATGLLERGSLVTVSRDGAVRSLGLGPRGLSAPEVSPDGRRIAVWIYDAFSDIWLFEPATRRLTRLTSDRIAARPLWAPDGKRLAYQSLGGSGYALMSVAADGSGPADTLFAADGLYGGGFTPDGRMLVFSESDPRTGKRRIGYVTLGAARTPHVIVGDAFNNYAPNLSPDGRWMVYVSDESGEPEVYVRPFPGPGGRWQISSGGGTEPRWSPTGREIFFRKGTAMMAVPVQGGATFVPGEPRQLFQGPYATEQANSPDYSVSRDGRTFLMVRLESQTADQPIVVVLNWFENLRAGRAGAGGAGR